MLVFYLLFHVFAEAGHCKEYKGILDRYQDLLHDHENCVRTIGDNQATIRSYENLLINGLQQQIVSLKGSLSAVVSEKDQIQKSVADMKSRISEVEDNENDSRKVEEKVKILEEKIDALSRTEDVSSYFSATSHSSATSTGVPIPLPVILSENKSGFNGVTGVMTVKIPGVYFWNCAFMTNSMSTHVRLVHSDGKHLHYVHRSHNSQGSGHFMLPVTATLVLEKGDQVWVELKSGRLISNSHQYSQCSAFKIA